MTLYAYPIDLFGCGHYRVMYPADAMPEHLASQVKVVYPGDSGGIQATIVDGEVVDVDVPTDCTAVLVQRPTSASLATTLTYLRRKGVEVILDVDDDLEALSPHHPTARQFRALPDHDASFPRLVAGFANRVVVSTDALAKTFARYVQPGVPVSVVRNRIPRALIQDPWERRDEPTLGWPGSLYNHPGDLDVLGGSVSRLGCVFRIVGDEHRSTKPSLGAPYSYTGPVHFKDWIPTIQQELDVAVVPLKDHRFNRAKSALKAMELAAAGVPLVRPALPEFDLLGIGESARKPAHWYGALRTLLRDPARWSEAQAHNREVILGHTYEDHYPDFAEAWGLR